MKRLSTAAIVTLALALSACGKKDEPAPEATTTTNSMAGDPQPR
jgi:predicted small lipoprotein YifL